MACVAHLGEVESHIEQFRERHTNLLVVSQAKPAMLTLFLKHYPKPYPVVGDPERAVYHAFGLERANPWTFANPLVIAAYLKQIVLGTRVRAPYEGEDVLQLGGDFLLNRRGEIGYAYRSRLTTDRPGIPELLAAIPNE